MKTCITTPSSRRKPGSILQLGPVAASAAVSPSRAMDRGFRRDDGVVGNAAVGVSRNGINSMGPSPETGLSAVVFDCVFTGKSSMTSGRRLALKGPHAIAQGCALGDATKHRMSPERAKYGSVQWADLAGRKSLRTMPPFQGWNRVCVGFPGLRPGLSHSAPSGPAPGRSSNLVPLCSCGDEGQDSMRGHARAFHRAPWSSHP
jgi:hypothetical protein